MATTAMSPERARRIGLAAQGFGRPHPPTVTMRQVQGVIDRLGQFQIDSINVVERAHYLPLFSRLGPYDTGLLDRVFGQAPRRMFEYWGHAASLIDVALEPALRWRMAANATREWPEIARISAAHPGLAERVLAEVSERGPLTARQIDHDEPRDRSNWGWNWSSVKATLEWLFWIGELSSARRNAQFERCYDLPARVLPPEISALPALSAAEAHVALVRRAAAALGVASLACLSDYFRTGRADTMAAIRHLERTGELIAVTVPGWGPHWLWHQASAPTRINARALVCPFDSLIFERPRALRMFGLDYRIEVYVPAAQRRYGYYVYPFLLDESFVARVDLKADRSAGVLVINSAWLEPEVTDRSRVVRELVSELNSMAGWLGLTTVRPRAGMAGDLADSLARALG